MLEILIKLDGNLAEDECIGVDVLERVLLLILDGFLRAPTVFAAAISTGKIWAGSSL